jgi:hypothetical protein
MSKKPKMEYIVLCANVVGSGPFETAYSFDGRRFTDRDDAIKHGFTLGRSDDFNIGVLRDGELLTVDWMTMVVDREHDLMRNIEKQICLR